MTSSSQHDQSIFHAINFREDICIGCSHCMNVCPTEAVRVKGGKAKLIAERCVDCGECYRVCPVGAICVDQDNFEIIFHYPVRVALIPAVFFGQFSERIEHAEILGAIYDLGFTHVYEVEEGAILLNQLYAEYKQENIDRKPLISPFCPAIVRLIEIKFPTLLDHIILLKAPLEITAMRARKEISEEGTAESEIGIFYFTPCAAKIVAIKSPLGEKESPVTGVFNINHLYNKTLRILRNLKEPSPIHKGEPRSFKESCWSLTHGETDLAGKGRNLAIDEIRNVIEFLEKLENEEIKEIDFLELRACDESCAGGILCPGNRFLTAEKMKQRNMEPREGGWGMTQEIENHLRQHVKLDRILPRPIYKLDDQVAQAVVKMKRMYELNTILPQVDCGICGSPSCKALAEDIVRHQADINQCIFIQKILEQNEKLDPEESTTIMKSIWSGSKLDKNSLKDEIQ